MKKFTLTVSFVLAMIFAMSLNTNGQKLKDVSDKAKKKVDDKVKPMVDDKVLEEVEKKSEKVREQTDKGVIDWTEQYVEATGMSAIDTARFKIKAQAKLMARRGAIVDAQRNLLEIINGVRVVGETKVEDMIATNDYIYSRVDGVIKGAVMVGEPIEQDGLFMVTMRVPLYEKDGLAPAVVDDKKITPPTPPVPTPTNDDIPEFIGFDLDGKKYDPALFPLIVDEEGNVLADLSKIYDPQQGKFPKILKSSKEILEAAGMKQGVDLINVISAQDGKIVVSTDAKKKFNWDKLFSTATKISKFIMLLI